MSAILLSAMVLIIALVVLYRRLKPILVSPVYGLIFVYLIIFIVGVAIYNPDYSDLDMSPAEAAQVLSQSFLIVSAFIAGACVVLFRDRNLQVLRRTIKDLKGFQLSAVQIKWAFALPIICFVSTVASYGLANLWYTPDYLPSQNVLLSSLANTSSLAAALVLGVIAGQNSKKATQVALLLQVVLLVLMAAVSSRRFAVLPLLFCFGTLFARPASRAWRALLFATILFTPLTLMVPILTRDMGGTGLSTFPQIPSVIAENDLSWETGVLLNNVMMGPPLTVESERPISTSALAYILTSISPTPGVWTNWYESMERVNLFEPFNALGDLLRAGIWVALLYYAFVGAYFARIELRLRSGTQVQPEVLLLIGLSFAFTVMSTEYPLRSSTRYIYYMIAIEVMAALFARMRMHMRSVKKAQTAE